MFSLNKFLQLLTVIVLFIPAPSFGETGSIQGKVVYKTDKSRPWRYGRYYIKNSRTGLLAEAVVGLKDRKLATTNEKPQRFTIDQVDHMFTPETVALQVGDSVRFTNSDAALHSVKTNDPANAFSTTISKGQEHVHSFLWGGNFKPAVMECAYHGSMRAWVYVFNHPYFSLSKENGEFTMNNIPPGTYELLMHHPAGRLVWKKKITVTAGETINLTIEVSPENLIE